MLLQKEDQIIHIVKQQPSIGYKRNDCYMICIVRKICQNGQKAYQAHRIIWECHNGQIPEGKVIDHINNNRSGNPLCNLQLMTSTENNKKSAKKRDYQFTKGNYKNRKFV